MGELSGTVGAFTDFHAKYYAWELTRKRSGDDVDRLSQSLFDATVDLNPHQIDAAVFALRNPLSKGVLLADEVGLGKTIEAALVLSQFWAERRRRLLVICPASLRKQWATELAEKFHLPTQILPGRDETREQAVDLVETFNWLIGLHVELLDKPRTFAAEFEREADPDLPEDANTRLRVAGRLREREDGGFWFRMVEGWVARTPGSTEDVDKVLVLWRKLTDDPEEDAAVLESLLANHLRINQRDTEFDAIYINGPHGLSTDFEGKHRLHSLEEAFHSAMWAVD